MKAKEKRLLKGYKIPDTKYNKAMRMAKKQKQKLASLIEKWVISYAENGTPIEDDFAELEEIYQSK